MNWSGDVNFQAGRVLTNAEGPKMLATFSKKDSQ